MLTFTCRYLCPCALSDKEAVQELTLDYQRELRNLISTGRYDTSDFTVVVQPFFRDATPPRNRVRSHLLIQPRTCE